MTAPKPEAPTLDSTDAAVGKRWRENSSLEEWFPYTAQELNGLRERLCAIDNAKGMPEEPKLISAMREARNGLVELEYINALRLHAQHLQDRLNRMGAAGQMCVDALLHRGVSTDPEHPDRLAVDAMSAALLAKVEGRE